MINAKKSSLIPPGYKQTEVGVIPDDWNILPVKNIAPLQRGFDLPTRLILEGEYPVVYSNGIMNWHKEYMVYGPGVVTGRSGTIGNIHYVPDHFWPHNTALWVTSFYGNKPKYIYYLFQSLSFNRYSTGSGVPTLNRNDIHGIKVALPKPQEQQAIAEALSDVDDLIGSLEKLIAKKRAIKTGAMQQLLTGKQRLPGFEGEWECTTLGNIIDKIIGGGTPSRSNPIYWGDEIPWVTVKDFSTFNPCHAQESITGVGLKNSSSNMIPKGTLITSTRMALGKAVIYEVDVTINQDLKALFPKDCLINEFLYYWFQFNEREIDELGSGSTVKGISLPDLKSLGFILPSTKEQQAIADVLSDMDAEIQALDAKLNKTKAIKQGMMSELLTGKTRLVSHSN